MKAEDHFQKAQRLEKGQHQLDPVHYGELVIEGCYMAAHHYIEAGTEWRGVSHPQAHAHKDNVRLLKQANAPNTVQDAWRTLETLRPSGIYGKEPDELAGAKAQAALQVIKDWAEEARPHP
jgi:hypothetical protein